MANDSDLAVLSGLRAYPTRTTSTQLDILARGRKLVGERRTLGHQEWTVLEQVAIAALQVGELDLAEQCIARLVEQFPDSPRVEKLRGMALEAAGDEAAAQDVYDALLEADPSNVAVRKRLVAMERAKGNLKEALNELLLIVDTWYADTEAWLELADIYAECGLYPQSLSALSHTLILNPQNPFHVLRSAETAYTAQDVPLALQFFLRAVEMMDDAAEESGGTKGLAGAETRGWYGVKLCVRRLLTPSSPPASSSPSNTAVTSDQKLALLDELATERILAAYSSPAVRGLNQKAKKEASVPADVRGVVLKWLQGK